MEEREKSKREEKEEKVFVEIAANKVKELEEKEPQKMKENEPAGKFENIDEGSKTLNAGVVLVAEENHVDHVDNVDHVDHVDHVDDHVDRSEATILMKEFFQNKLEDEDCRTFVTTKGEVNICIL